MKIFMGVIGVIGFFLGVLAIASAPPTAGGFVGALLFGGLPLLIGVVALGSAGVMERVDVARDRIILAMRQVASFPRVPDQPQMPVTCVRCGRVVPLGTTVPSGSGPTCTPHCKRD